MGYRLDLETMLRVLMDLVKVSKDEYDHSSYLGSHCRELLVDLAIFLGVQFALLWTDCSNARNCKSPVALLVAQAFFAIGNVTLWCAQVYLMRRISKSGFKDAELDY